MCYILYGAVNKEINESDREKVAKNSKYTFKPGTKHDLKEDINNLNYDYRVTWWQCDCDFPVGLHNADAKELRELEKLLLDLKTARGVKCVYLARVWAGKKCKKEETVHIDDIDIPAFLADIETECIYRIDLFERFC
jgi:hypothetical protein